MFYSFERTFFIIGCIFTLLCIAFITLATNDLLTFMNIYSDSTNIITYVYASVVLIFVYWCTFILILLHEYILITNLIIVILIILFVCLAIFIGGGGYNMFAAFLFAVGSPSLLFLWLGLLAKEILKMYSDQSKPLMWLIIITVSAIIVFCFFIVYSWFIWDVILRI